MPNVRTHEQIAADYSRDEELNRFMQSQPGTRFFRKHIPSGRITAGTVTPAAARTVVGEFDEAIFPRIWKDSLLHRLVSTWNRQGAGVWQYWAA